MAKYNTGLRYNSKINYSSAPIIIFITDSGNGSDSVEIVSVFVAVEDTGTGIDTASINSLVSVIDSSIGADDVTAIANVLAIDSGQVNETISITVNAEAMDTGTGADAAMVAKTYYLVDANNTLRPLNVKVLSDSMIDLMPEIKVESDVIPGRHGEIYFDSKLGVRVIELKVLSNDFAVEDREALKRTMAQYLSPTGEAKPLVFFDDIEKQYLVKYAGKIDLTQYPTWMQFTLPFKSASPYIQGSFEMIHSGSGMLNNKGNLETPLVIEIAGPVSNPIVSVGIYTLTYTGTIDEGSTLIIDVENMAAELDGVNVLPDYSGGFPWLSVGYTTVTGASAGTTTFRWRARYL